jgi:hypothetical protein
MTDENEYDPETLQRANLRAMTNDQLDKERQAVTNDAYLGLVSAEYGRRGLAMPDKKRKRKAASK